MKLPTLAFFFVLGLVLFGVQAFRSSAQTYDPLPVSDGTIMGEDFAALLSNPAVSLEVVQVEGAVYFAWNARNPAHLEQLRRMGEYMQSVKRTLEQRGGVPRDVAIEQVRTASKSH